MFEAVWWCLVVSVAVLGCLREILGGIWVVFAAWGVWYMQNQVLLEPTHHFRTTPRYNIFVGPWILDFWCYSFVNEGDPIYITNNLKCFVS